MPRGEVYFVINPQDFYFFFFHTRYFKDLSPSPSVKELATSKSLLCFFGGWFGAREPVSAPLLWGKEGPGEFDSGTESLSTAGLQLFVGVLLSIWFGFAGLAG